jgi:methylated-DNA-[protein]-cysteine S-methyltransferase
MMDFDHDPDHALLTAELAELTVDAPEGLLDRVAARWLRTPAPLGDLYVAFTDLGIAYTRIAESVADDDAVFATGFRRRFGRPLLPASRPPAGLVPALRTGRGRGLRFDLRGSSQFEREVLGAVATIPRGQLRPYSWIARQIGRPGAVRAVGSALNHNPVPLLIPCHRVVLSNGSIGDYVFGPLAKRRLLDGEGVNLGEIDELAGRGIQYLASDTTGVVCFPTCAHARRIAPAHRHGFRSIAQALEAGYRPCRHCAPLSAAGPGRGERGEAR